MLSTVKLTMRFGAKTLFEDISVKFGNHNKYGLIGANGCGKSTLLKVLGNELEASSGSVIYDPNERVAMLRQDQFAYEDQIVMDVVMMGHPEFWKIHLERDRIYALEEMTEEEGLRIGELENEYAELDGYTAESRAGELLGGLGIPEEQHCGPMSAVAPGWKMRVLLAQALFANPDILLLDEPSNNLDINTIRWLEGMISTMECTVIIISHDRHFLNSVCTHMADIDYGELRMYHGNYDEYMIAATAARERLLADNAKKKVQIAELQQFVSRFSANASKSRQATSRQKQIDKIQLEEVKPSSRINPYIIFEQEKKLYKLVVEAKNLCKSYGALKVIKDFNVRVDAGEKIAIIGPNGIGKSTLLRMLAGDLAADRGEVAWSQNAKVGYFAQDHAADFEKDMMVFEWMKQWTTNTEEQVIRAALGRMLFRADDIKKSVQVLSGGEQGRMLFGKLTLQQNNVLLMDEPTNHLDMESIESLNSALDAFPGTLIFVSHDREFVSSLATRIIELTPTGVVNYTGTYEDYLASQK